MQCLNLKTNLRVEGSGSVACPGIVWNTVGLIRFNEWMCFDKEVNALIAII